jgi:hypothetical protein
VLPFPPPRENNASESTVSITSALPSLPILARPAILATRFHTCNCSINLVTAQGFGSGWAPQSQEQ